ncbi:MAG: hypothetical protein K5769_03430 [Pseudobutyrivibrio sp.]|nr:hypothetical protein [Pseudobutyrivibrio sp.]
MKTKGFKRKNLIAFVLAAVLAVGGLCVYTNAAERIDVNKPISITAIADPSSAFGQNYQGELTVDMYKVADFNETGSITLTSAFKSDKEGEKIDLDVLSSASDSTDEKVKDIEAKVVKPAVAIVKSQNMAASDSFTVKRENGKLIGKKDISSGVGIYLYIPRDTEDDTSYYKFKPYVVCLPCSNMISQSTKVDENGNVVTTTDGSDAWLYDVTIALKSEVSPKYANLEIVKTLKTFNKSLGPAGFAFEVTAYDKGNNIVYNDVHSLNFEKSGPLSIVIKDAIPAGSRVVVEEVYSGASYTIVGDSKIREIESIPAAETTKVEFENDYPNKDTEGNIAIENHFVKEEKDGKAGYKFESSTLTKQNSSNTVEEPNN